MLYAFTPPQRKDTYIVESLKKNTKKYKLMLFVYVAWNLASGDDSGISNPFVRFKVGGEHVETQTIMDTLNPNFNEIVEMTIELSENINSSPPTLMILMYHDKNPEYR